MEADLMKCIRCAGRKKLYKVGSGYSYANIGGTLENCPMCQGVGKHKRPEGVVEVVEKKTPPLKKKKELDNGASN